uniref:Uncharacterized protein n=1 Tax=viral metagenome TaxID=1070528 RepID=A0A6C0IAZ5_9ZZZZ
MIPNLLICNSGGLGCSLYKYIEWHIFKNDSNTFYMFYGNKGINNDSLAVFPFDNISTDIHKNIFYKFFKFPENKTIDNLIDNNNVKITAFPWSDPNIIAHYPDIIKSVCELEKGSHIGCLNILKKINTPEFLEIRKIYNDLCDKYLKLTDEFEVTLQNELKYIKSLQKQGKKILCVMIRMHIYDGDDPISFLDKLIIEIDEKMIEYDYILPITQIDIFYDIICNHFKEKCIQIERKRLPCNTDWLKDVTDDQFENEIKYALLDICIASECDYILSGVSGMYVTAIMRNINVQSSLFKAVINTNY